MKPLLNSLWLITLLTFSTASVALEPVYTPWHNNLAIKGFDSVAYFKQNAAIEGRDEFSLQWNGATWLFSSEENKALFSASPEQYAPQFGGYCAYAVAQNKTAGIDPTQFTVLDGKLYLNYNKKIQQTWLNDRDIYIVEAEKNWPALLNK
jgi:YHS domain-containing protein